MKRNRLKIFSWIVVLLILCVVLCGCTSINPEGDLTGINKSDYNRVYLDKGGEKAIDIPIVSWEARGDMLLIETETTKFLVPRSKAILYGNKK